MFLKILSVKKVFFCGGAFAILFLIFSLVIFSIVTPKSSDRTLDFVFVVCRHGSRSPLFTYPTNQFADAKYWPDGIKGDLTNNGKMLMYNLGILLKNRYYDLFHEKYSLKNIYIKSTPTHRTYMSVALLLAGMFPPSGEAIWNKNLLWQPIPIWKDEYDKNEIVTSRTLCPNFVYHQDVEQNYSKVFIEENRDFFDYVIKESGKNITLIKEYINIWDPTICAVSQGLTLPDWMKKIYPEPMTSAASYMFDSMIGDSPIMKQLLTGPLIQDLHTWIVKKYDGSATEKMLIHSGHDFTIIGLLKSLGISNISIVMPSATVMIEFSSSSQGRFVKLLYANDSTVEEPMQLNMPYCKHPCPLESFYEIIKNIIPENDWDTECELKG